MRRILIIAVIAVLPSGPAWAQDPPPRWMGLKTAELSTVYVLDDAGSETPGKLLRIDPDALVILVGGAERRFDLAHVVQVRRRGDSLKNGALIGAGVGAALGLSVGFMQDCVDQQGNITRCGGGTRLGAAAFAGGIYAAIGAGIDALIQGRTTIYEAPSRSPSVDVVGVPGKRLAAAVTLRW